MTTHTDEETYVLCGQCEWTKTRLGIIRDIQDGKLEVTDEFIEDLRIENEMREEGMTE
jgi:hypothetical protein